MIKGDAAYWASRMRACAIGSLGLACLGFVSLVLATATNQSELLQEASKWALGGFGCAVPIFIILMLAAMDRVARRPYDSDS